MKGYVTVEPGIGSRLALPVTRQSVLLGGSIYIGEAI
jgi:hypothetical protein